MCVAPLRAAGTRYFAVCATIGACSRTRSNGTGRTHGRTDAWSYLHEFYAPTFRQNDDTLTPNEFGDAILAWRLKFPDFTVAVDRMFTWPGCVATRVTFTGTHHGDFQVLPATGRTISVGGLDIFEFDNGLVVQHWHETDHYDMFMQLGATIVPGHG